MTLTPCLQCRRHVRVDASICPFCGGGITPGLDVPEPQLPTKLGRAGLFFFASSIAIGAGVAGCPPTGGGAVYGGPPIVEPPASASPSTSASNNPGGAVPVEGTPPAK
jgi:hypothetical protein